MARNGSAFSIVPCWTAQSNCLPMSDWDAVFPDFGAGLMQTNIRALLIAAAAACSVLASPAWPAETAKNVRGTIASINGDAMQVRQSDGSSVTVRLAQNAKIVSVSKASLADV